MSGFAAIVGPVFRDDDLDWVAASLQFMRFRGPDAHALWHDDTAGLGGVLLATQPSESSWKPVASLEQTLWATGDVRLDGRADLVRRLGEQVEAGALSDLDLVLRAYRQWGDSCLLHLHGDFAFAVWDVRERRLFCGRDRFGVAQFFYTEVADHLLVGNTLECFFLQGDVADRLNLAVIGDFLVFGHNRNASSTCFEQIRRLPAASALIWSDGTTRVVPYWKPADRPDFLRLPRAGDYVEAFRTRLTEAVKDRMVEGLQSVQLSGGMDSTSVAVVADEVIRAGRPGSTIKAFTIELDGSIDSGEGTYAAMVSDALGIEREVLHAGEFTSRDPMVPEFVPPAPTAFVPTRLQHDFSCRMAAAGRTVLTGQGGDVLLRFRPSWWIERLSGGHLGELSRVMLESLRLFGRLPPLYLGPAWSAYRERPAPQVPLWLNYSFESETGILERTCEPTTDVGWDDALSWYDPGFTRLLLRFRHPLFDTRFADYLARLPPVPWFPHKRILREAMRGRLPDRVRLRPKKVLDVKWDGSPSPFRQHPRMVELVTGTPAARQFLDCQQLANHSASAVVHPWGMETSLMNALGLVFWLHHWRRPRPGTTEFPAVESRPQNC